MTLEPESPLHFAVGTFYKYMEITAKKRYHKCKLLFFMY